MKNETKKERRIFWITRAEHKKFVAYSKKIGKSMSDIIRTFIRELK